MKDAQIIRQLGGPDALTQPLSIKLDAARKYMQRGIPYKFRPAVKKLADAKRIKLPVDFLEVQR